MSILRKLKSLYPCDIWQVDLQQMAISCSRSSKWVCGTWDSDAMCMNGDLQMAAVYSPGSDDRDGMKYQGFILTSLEQLCSWIVTIHVCI